MIFRIMALAHEISRKSWKLLDLSRLSVSQSWKNLGFLNISNNFHDFPNYDSGSRDLPKIMEILGFTNIFRESILKILVLPSISKLVLWFTKFLEIHGNYWNFLFAQYFA